MTTLEHLAEALYQERLRNMHSPAGSHIVSALATFGAAGQSVVVKINARAQDARRNSPALAVTHSKAPAKKLRNFIHPASPGEPSALPSAQQPPMQDRIVVKLLRIAEPTAPPPEKSIVQVAEGGSLALKDIASTPNVGGIGRPTTAINWFGTAQIRKFLADHNIEHDAEATDREAAALLIAHFRNAE